MRIHRRLYGGGLAALLAGGALVAGCGGGDDGATTNTLTQSQLQSKAAAICRPVDKRIEAAAHRYLGPGRPTAAQFQKFATVAVVPETQKLIDGLKRLTPPPSRAQVYSALLSELQSTNDRLKANPRVLAQAGDPFAKSTQLAKQAGLNACAAD